MHPAARGRSGRFRRGAGAIGPRFRRAGMGRCGTGAGRSGAWGGREIGPGAAPPQAGSGRPEAARLRATRAAPRRRPSGRIAARGRAPADRASRRTIPSCSRIRSRPHPPTSKGTSPRCGGRGRCGPCLCHAPAGTYETGGAPSRGLMASADLHACSGRFARPRATPSARTRSSRRRTRDHAGPDRGGSLRGGSLGVTDPVPHPVPRPWRRASIAPRAPPRRPAPPRPGAGSKPDPTVRRNRGRQLVKKGCVPCASIAPARRDRACT